MTTRNIQAASRQARSNPEAAYALDKQQVSNYIEDVYNNKLKDIKNFKATILSIEGTLRITQAATKKSDKDKAANFFEVILRPEWYDLCPPPWSFKDFKVVDDVIQYGPMAEASRKSHPDARSKQSVGSANTRYLRVGDIVLCTFEDGPDNKGRHRNIRFDLNSMGREKKVDLIIGSLGSGNLFSGNNFLGTSQEKYTGELGSGWKPADSIVKASGLNVRCGDMINFGRTTQVDYFAYADNPEPSEETDNKFWALVLKKLGTNSTKNKIRFFKAWARKEGRSMAATSNPFATSWPGGKGKAWSTDPNMTTFNWNKGDYSWVKNYSKIEYGAEATAKTINSKQYNVIINKLKEANPEFTDSWFESHEVKYAFAVWGGGYAKAKAATKGEIYKGKIATFSYAKGVHSNYKRNNFRKVPINTNKPGGRSAKCVKGN